jgi:hypothetical protein
MIDAELRHAKCLSSMATSPSKMSTCSTGASALPILRQMVTCRVCGSACAEYELLLVHQGGGCRTCNGSPACTRCGHARRRHRGTFGGGEPGCKARVTPEVGLAVGRCGCVGYTADAAAFTESNTIVDVTELRLRLPGESTAPLDSPSLAPVRDMFDEPRRLRDLSELDDVPWRPPS